MKMTPNDELEFAYKVRAVLDEGVDVVPEKVVSRLEAARKKAIALKKPEMAVYVAAPVPRFAGVLPAQFRDAPNWLIRVGFVIPLLLLVLGSVGIYYYEQERSIDDLADLDAAVLADELPINAYLDHGFNSYLNKHGE